eukprot:6906189-Pyramimonas_sp.AAC.1
MDDADAAFQMIFADPGTSTRPAKNTFPLTSMFQGSIDFDLNGGLASALQSDCFVPAWMVGITEKQRDSNVQMTHVEYKGKINEM